MSMLVVRRIKDWLRPLLKWAGKNRTVRPQITYYPAFNDSTELTSHYYRAAWYLPYADNKCEKVHLFVKKEAKLQDKPEYMCEPALHPSHIETKLGKWPLMLSSMYHSKLVLVWDNKPSVLLKILGLMGIKVLNVDTDDLESKEYGIYCGMYWKHLLPETEKQIALQESYQRLTEAADIIKRGKIRKACVFGTGPSLEEAEEFDFTDCLTIVCNSTIQNDRLMDHIQPTFVSAGDVVSHFGVSSYAAAFREDMIRVLKQREMYFIGSAPFAYIFLLNHPEIAARTILIDQTMDDPNYNLLQSFGLPRLDSTLNIHMLPLANTFADEIFILGCDGKSEKRDNEDFWAHAKGAQYNDLVDTGHLCHPTFDIHRQQATYNRYQDSTLTSLNVGEQKYGKRYFTLKPSNIDALKPRLIPGDWLKAEQPIIAQIPSEVFTEDIDVSLSRDEIVCQGAVSNAVIDEQSTLTVRGWALCNQPIERIEVYLNDRYLGRAIPGSPRNDIYAQYPQFDNRHSGYTYVTRLHKKQTGEIVVKLINESGASHTIMKKID